MAQYIDKDALAAEIERRIKQFVKENNTLLKNSDNAKELRSRIIMCKEVFSFLTTLEVKEVDLEEKACDAYCKVCGHYAHTTPNHICRQTCDYYKNFKNYMKRENSMTIQEVK